ncbi:hypothetical protein [Pseudomonas sp. NPDC087336]|jgi:hypothetical protein|uniref:hypothetical protein n=1 Tax=Pseudomonas sp. NPDC087336 TaxID=3364436 RepID=UPI0037F7C336
MSCLQFMVKDQSVAVTGIIPCNENQAKEWAWSSRKVLMSKIQVTVPPFGVGAAVFTFGWYPFGIA